MDNPDKIKVKNNENLINHIDKDSVKHYRFNEKYE